MCSALLRGSIWQKYKPRLQPEAARQRGKRAEQHVEDPTSAARAAALPNPHTTLELPFQRVHHYYSILF